MIRTSPMARTSSFDMARGNTLLPCVYNNGFIPFKEFAPVRVGQDSCCAISNRDDRSDSVLEKVPVAHRAAGGVESIPRHADEDDNGHFQSSFLWWLFHGVRIFTPKNAGGTDSSAAGEGSVSWPVYEGINRSGSLSTHCLSSFCSKNDIHCLRGVRPPPSLINLRHGLVEFFLAGHYLNDDGESAESAVSCPYDICCGRRIPLPLEDRRSGKTFRDKKVKRLRTRACARIYRFRDKNSHQHRFSEKFWHWDLLYSNGQWLFHPGKQQTDKKTQHHVGGSSYEVPSSEAEGFITEGGKGVSLPESLRDAMRYVGDKGAAVCRIHEEADDEGAQDISDKCSYGKLRPRAA